MDRMSNDDFRVLYAMLDRLHERRTGVSLSSLHAGGLYIFSKKVRADLEQFEVEVISRAKAAAENAASLAETIRDDVGRDAWDAAQPNYENGLEFGDTIKDEL